MNTVDDDAFVRKAVALAGDREDLSRIRALLAQARHEAGLFDMSGFATDFVHAARQMADRARQGLSPQSFG
jgi:predicted O-linked N-acetylglucosamine transferase (SPINDLY family)